MPVLITGCATTRVVGTEKVITNFPESNKSGIYHKLKQGETIWRIAKTYDVAVGDLIKANNIPDIAKVEKGQLIFIPGALAVKNVVLDADGSQKEFIWPVKGKVVRYFCQHYRGQLNRGIDIQARAGEVVKAARTGRVVFADYLAGYAYTVILDHSDGFYSVYAHNAKLLTKLGALVLKNNAIAYVGEIGGKAYLHFEIRRHAISDNPLYYLP